MPAHPSQKLDAYLRADRKARFWLGLKLSILPVLTCLMIIGVMVPGGSVVYQIGMPMSVMTEDGFRAPIYTTEVDVDGERYVVRAQDALVRVEIGKPVCVQTQDTIIPIRQLHRLTSLGFCRAD